MLAKDLYTLSVTKFSLHAHIYKFVSHIHQQSKHSPVDHIMKIETCILTLALLSLLNISLSIVKGLDTANAHRRKRAINWNDNWAFACDFSGNDMGSVQVRDEDCGGRCTQTSGCTHFTWTTYNGGTCWLKSGSVSKSDATSTNDASMVCGIIGSSPTSSGTAASQVVAGLIKCREVIPMSKVAIKGVPLPTTILMLTTSVYKVVRPLVVTIKNLGQSMID